MSKTMAVDVVGPSHWAYMAKVMAEVFDAAAKNGFIRKENVPGGALADATEFCGLVLEGYEISSNPPASIQAFSVALKVVTAIAKDDFPNMERFYLGCTIIIAMNAGSTCGFGVREIGTTFKFMAGFFRELWKMGEEEGFEKAMSSEELDE